MYVLFGVEERDLALASAEAGGDCAFPAAMAVAFEDLKRKASSDAAFGGGGGALELPLVDFAGGGGGASRIDLRAPAYFPTFAATLSKI